jgi:glycerophosphoryl diester phosphodiesterase
MHPSGRPLVISHRTNEGDSPENTLLGIERAIADGCDAVVVDVRATRDGVLVLMHDETLERTTGDPRAVADVTLEALRALRCGGPQGFEPQPIPTLEETLACLDGRIAIVIDVPAPGEAIEASIAEAVRRAGAEAWTWLTPTFDDEVERTLRRFPGFPTYFDLTHQPLPPEAIEERIRLAGRLGVTGINPIHTALTPEAVALAHGLGLQVACWTVDEPSNIARVIALGVDAITTNYPKRVFQAARDALGSTA